MERNNIMNVFGHLLKRDRGQTFGEKSRSHIKSDQSLVNSKSSSKISKVLHSLERSI